MTRALILSIAICLFPVSSNASGEDLQQRLNATYKDKIYVLRHPIANEHQHYGSAGELLTSAAEGPWTIYGALEIKSVSLSSSQLRLTANRLIYTYDPMNKDLLPNRIKWEKAKVSIDVTLSRPITTADEADTILHRILAFGESELVETAPDYWRPFLNKQTPTIPSPAEGGALETKRDSPEIFNLVTSPGVTRPKPVHTPEPEFSEFARRFHMEGTVVLKIIIDKTGAVVRPEIARPLGSGLDEKAVEAVRSWKFKPAMRDGKPVAVEMTIEVAFNLT
jgi:TonB family protein